MKLFWASVAIIFLQGLDDEVAKAQSKKRKYAAVHGVLEAKYTLRPIAVSEYCISHEQEDDTVDDENIEE